MAKLLNWVQSLFSRKAAPRRSGPPVLAIAAIFKNEGPYILEWIAHHRSLGITRFFIANNNSDDGSTALLDGLERAGIIRHIPFPGVEGKPPQMDAYDEIMRRHRTEADWFFFIDGDEFLRPMADGVALTDWLGRMPEGVGSIGLNWANFGSSHRIAPGVGLVHERFTLRAPDDTPVHQTFKSIVRSRDWRGTVGHPHRFAIPANRRFVDTSGKQIQIQRTNPGRGSWVCWDVVRIDHFIIKSKAEYTHKKRARGTGQNQQKKMRSARFFDQHDLNDVADPFPPHLLARLKAEMEILRGQLADLPPEARDLDLQLDKIPPVSAD